MEIIIIIVLMLIVVYYFNKPKNNKVIKDNKPIQSNNKHHKQVTQKGKNYVIKLSSYKLIENDNYPLDELIGDYNKRFEILKNDYTKRLGSYLDNDIKWNILGDIVIENTLVNPYLHLNAEYKRGLQLQKEKIYKQAIYHFTNGFVYLMCYSEYKYNPVSHIIDYIETKEEVFEQSQYKFLNKLYLCYKQGKITTIDADEMIHKGVSNICDNNGDIFDKHKKNIISYIKYRVESEPKEIIVDENITNVKDVFEDIELLPANMRKLRTSFRKIITKYKKDKDENNLKRILNIYYKFCAIQQSLFGYFELKYAISSASIDIAHLMLNQVIDELNDVSFIKNGYMIQNNFISNNDYKIFVKVFGTVESKTDYKIMYDKLFYNIFDKKTDEGYKPSFADEPKSIIVYEQKHWLENRKNIFVQLQNIRNNIINQY